MIVSSAFAGKTYAVLGLARSGLAAVESLIASGARVRAWDSREEAREAVVARFNGAVTIADPLTGTLAGCDGIVVSPGVPLNRHPVAAAARDAGVPVIGDIELFAKARPGLPPHRVVAITGTNGKSTVTALVHHLCEEAGLATLMGGNIGLPILAQQPLEPNDRGTGVYVLELSSYQIDLTSSLAAEIAVLINLSPDHLDRYDGYDAYVAAKSRLFAMQDDTGHAVLGTADADTRRIGRDLLAGRGEGRVHIAGTGGLDGQEGWPALQGPHNLQNAATAVAVAGLLGIGEDCWRPALASFAGLPHRMERIAEHRGVLFVNDSKATNPASAAPALAAFPPRPERRVRWIVGGLAKSDDLDACEPFFDHVAAAYTIGESGPRFAELLGRSMPVIRCETLSEALRQAMAAAAPGEVVLLSPACASFDQFRDFEARGDAFRDLVTALIEDGRCPAVQASGARP